MRILVAPDKFKGSVSAHEAAQAIARGLRRGLPNAEIILLPIADGGEGTAEAICTAKNGRWMEMNARDPIGESIRVRYAWIDGEIAVIEMSEAAGLRRVPIAKRNLLVASTFGVGEMIADAIQRGAKKIIVGLGGSGTNDGGIGMAAALGFEFLTSDGEPIKAVPSSLLALTRIERSETFEPPEITAACDVQNPLLGSTGATRVYGAQKGADEITSHTLELGLENLADVCAEDFGRDFRDQPGAGAAGGLGFGLLTFCHAHIRSGFEVVAEILELEKAIAAADIVITGEGRLDAQTLFGKGPFGVATLARKYEKQLIAFCGSFENDPQIKLNFPEIHEISNGADSPEFAMRNAATLLEQTVLRACSAFEA